MNYREIRNAFFDFFRSKGHKIVPSAPLLNKDDPTLMFVNAGMNQFKDYFLGHAHPDNPRIADTQKCLRVSGKHNDLEDVGRDSYHHTFFEMLGNWSFGDYFKAEAIAWAWEFLTEVVGIDKDRIYVTVFGGCDEEGVPFDTEAREEWKKWVSEDRILAFGKKDNFWEMGDTGPCGPSSEIHVDMRPDAERAKVPGVELVNKDHPDVIEIWNLVFIQYNRKADGKLEPLPANHVDTGMGFERLCRVLQKKDSTYDTDVFARVFAHIEKASGLTYGHRFGPDAKQDMAMRVVADHIRAVAFAIADGALPSNTGAGYVIRRILRRAVRYYFSFLNIREPFMHTLVPVLAADFEDVFPELKAQESFVRKVIFEEERAFLRTLETGLKRFESLDVPDGVIPGKVAFELYDTYGFPIDLTRLIAAEKGWQVDEAGFERELEAQKARSRDDAKRQVGDWVVLNDVQDVEFAGYDTTEIADARIAKYRTVLVKDRPQYQIVLDKTPFYPEGGGQVGDKGVLIIGGETITVYDTKKENDLIIHYVEKLPGPREDLATNPVTARVDAVRRRLTANNHSATHLLHAALRQVLGTHVQQKGSLVTDTYLRFDFSHFQKMTDEELARVEAIVNEKIRQNIERQEDRRIPIEAAREAGAVMLFGEKYGDVVRMITFDPAYSRELCGGIHVERTGQIGLFKIRSESAVAAGVRRIEAVTGPAAEAFVNEELAELKAIRGLFKNPSGTYKRVAGLLEENKALRRQVEKLTAAGAKNLAGDLRNRFVSKGDFEYLTAKVEVPDAKALKALAFDLAKSRDKAVVALGASIGGKPQLIVTMDKALAQAKHFDAGAWIREAARAIKGGGGGQPHFATAGGKDVAGLDEALEFIRQKIEA